MRRRFALCLLMLAASSSAAPSQPGFLLTHQSEGYLLQRRVPADKLRRLDVWDSRLADWRNARAEEQVSEAAPILVLHLWADYCAPCREEFPYIRQTVETIERRFGQEVRWVLLSETQSPSDMRAFLGKYGASLPAGPQYLDSGEAIAASLRPSTLGALSYPVTVVLDSRRIVRYAIVGRVIPRRIELLDAIDRLLDLERPARANTEPSR
jgi:thiol-disulfide isomerase/thioredoxin